MGSFSLELGGPLLLPLHTGTPGSQALGSWYLHHQPPGSQAFRFELNYATGFPGSQLTDGGLWGFQASITVSVDSCKKSPLISLSLVYWFFFSEES